MKIEKTEIPGLIHLVPKVFEDPRGYFLESYNKQVFESLGIHDEFVQDNQSRSSHGVIRGLHYQLEPHAQSKLVRVIAGKICDVVVDLRKGSPTFGKWLSIELDGERKNQLYIPRGLAHGFSVLSNFALVFYKTDNYYHPASERGIRYDDPGLNIDWEAEASDVDLSLKDSKLPAFKEAEHHFKF